MDSNPSFTFLPPPPDPNPSPNPNPRIIPANHHHLPSTVPTNLPTQPPDLHATLSTLKQLIHLSKTTIHSVSNLLPTTTTTTASTATCPYDFNHRVPPSSLFHHHLQCPSSPATIDLAILDSLHYPSSTNNQNNSYSAQITPNDSNTDLCFSLADYHTSLDSNFFYRDCPAVVTFPHNINANCILTLPAVLSAECENDDVIETIDSLNSSLHLFELLPSEYCNVRTEINQWNDYPSSYSYIALRSIVCGYVSQKEDLMEWIIVNSPFYGVVIDVFMRDHILLLFRICLKAIVKEAINFLVSISKGETTGGNNQFKCPVLVRVLMWLASQLAILYGDVNGKLFAINILKQSLLIASSKSLFLYDEQKVDESAAVNEVNGKSVNKENDQIKTGTVLISQVAAAVAALYERFVLETRIRALRARFVPVYQRVQEHEYISKKAEEERKKRPNYRPIIEHDGVLWHRGGNQDANKNKSREELLAEERDYKRRRMSYRGKKMKRSTTQVMRDIIEEYMEEIKHANMANQPPVDTDKHIHDENKDKNSFTDSVSNIKEKRYKNKHNEQEEEYISKKTDRHRSSSRTRDHGQRDDQKRSTKYYDSNDDYQRSKHKSKRSSLSVIDEFEDRYDPSKYREIND